MSINEELSFTEYTLTEDTTDFIISFDRIGGSTDEVSILVNNTPIEELVGYTVLQVNFSTWQVTPALPVGTVVRLARTTNLDKMVYVFTAGSKFIAKNVDDNFKQIQHSQQEIRDRQDKLELDATALLLEVQDVKIIAEQAALDANAALDKVDEILNTGVVPASMILTSDGGNQQQFNDTQAEINLYGGKKYDMPAGGYPVGSEVILATGDRVKSTIPNNTNDPNLNMTGWENLSAVNQYLFPFYTLKKFGAKGDSITDDRQAFQDASDYLSGLGGGTLIVPDGEYLLNSKANIDGINADALVVLRPNVSIVGLGQQSKIKVGSFSNKKFYAFYNYTQNLGNITVSNLFIDANGQGNLPDSNYGYDQWVIATGIANQVQIDGVHVTNAGGQQVFSVGSNVESPSVKVARITNNRIYKTGQDIAGNIQGDHSSFYVAAESAVITSNSLENDAENLTSTAIECHSIRQIVTNNNIINFNVGVITAATVRSLNSVLIANNNIKARKAWHLWVYDNFDIRDIIFGQNNCTFATVDGVGFLDFATQVQTPMTGSLLIVGNNIIGDKREIRAQGFYGVYVGDIENIAIKNNSFQGVIGRPIEFGVITSAGKVSIDIESNTFNECNSTTDTLYKECIAFNTLTSIKRLSIKRNTCVSQSSAFSHKILSGVCTVGEFEFVDNSEVGSGFIQQPTWLAGKLTKSHIKHKTNVLGRPTLPANLGSEFKVGSSEYKRVKEGGVNALWNAVHYTGTGKPTSYDSFDGDRAINTFPVVGQPSEWVCVGNGNPGTWAATPNLVTAP